MGNSRPDDDYDDDDNDTKACATYITNKIIIINKMWQRSHQNQI